MAKCNAHCVPTEDPPNSRLWSTSYPQIGQLSSHIQPIRNRIGIQLHPLWSLSRPVCVNSAGLSVDIKWTLAGYLVGLQWARSGHCILPFSKMQHFYCRFSPPSNCLQNDKFGGMQIQFRKWYIFRCCETLHLVNAFSKMLNSTKMVHFDPIWHLANC